MRDSDGDEYSGNYFSEYKQELPISLLPYSVKTKK